MNLSEQEKERLVIAEKVLKYYKAKRLEARLSTYGYVQDLIVGLALIAEAENTVSPGDGEEVLNMASERFQEIENRDTVSVFDEEEEDEDIEEEEEEEDEDIEEEEDEDEDDLDDDPDVI